MDKAVIHQKSPSIIASILVCSSKSSSSLFLLKMCEYQCFCFPVCVSAQEGFCVQISVRIKAANLCLVLGLFWFLHPKGTHIIL